MRGFSYLDDEGWIASRQLEGLESLNDRPISDSQAVKVATFMHRNFGPKVDAATAGTPFPAPLLPAIVCQETAYMWLGFLSSLTPQEVLERCVLDASGDVNGSRHAFPRNTAAFKERYDDAFSSMLIEEANKTRALRGFGPKQWVYCGYGLFQYDLQHVISDEAFFRHKQWYDIDVCLIKVMSELKTKYAATHDLWEAVRAYNGSGASAQTYKHNVQHFFAICERTWTAPAIA